MRAPRGEGGGGRVTRKKADVAPPAPRYQEAARRWLRDNPLPPLSKEQETIVSALLPKLR